MSSAELLHRIRSTVLSNGLKLILLKKPGAPVVSAQVWYRTGSANEREGERGISHFFEHMMFRGSAKYGPQEHARRVNECGGHCNAFTAEDVTAYTNSVPVEHLEMVFALEADRMCNLVISSEVLETERAVIVEEYHTYLNNPIARAFLEFRRAFYGSHPYALSPLGEIEDIGAISVEQCREYYRRWYSPGNAVLVVVGAYASDAAVQDAAERFFGHISAGTVPLVAALPERGKQQRGPVPWVKRRVNFDVPILLSGYATPASSHPHALALEVLQQIVSHGETGRLHREMVRRSGLAVMAGGVNHVLRQSGMSLFFAAFTPDVSPRRISGALLAQIERFDGTDIDDGEVEKVRNALLTGRLFELYSAEHICQRIGSCETIDGDYRMWVERMHALEQIRCEELVAIARQYWSPANRWMLYLKPRKVSPLLLMAGLLRRCTPRVVRTNRGKS